MAVKIERVERPKLAQAERPTLNTNRRKKRSDPDFESMFDTSDGSPLEDLPDYEVGNLQEACDREMSVVEQEIEKNRAASEERFRVGRDPYYFCVLCFQTEEQKRDFLSKVKWDDLGDIYLSGLEIANRLGVSLEVIPIEPRKLRVNPKKFAREEVMNE